MVNLAFAQLRLAVSRPKADSAAADNEDRFGWRVAEDRHCLTLSVSDGASDGIFSDRWAALLTETLCATPEPSVFRTAIPELQRRWQQEVTREPLPWYAQARLQQTAAAAAILGFTIDANLQWQSCAVGDTNLFQVRGDQIIAAFPLSHADDFSGLPLLLPASGKVPEFLVASGVAESGDDFFIATDALAAWCLAEAARAGGNPWVWLRSFAEETDFERFLREQRASGRLRNDDTTLLHLRLGER